MKFKLGDLVRKTKGSNWQGRVVGTYATTLTPEGYAVESSAETGSVQIYPANALEPVHEGAARPVHEGAARPVHEEAARPVHEEAARPVHEEAARPVHEEASQLRFRKVRPVKSPQRAHAHDAGIDFFVPDDFSGVRLMHGASVLIPSGIQVAVPRGWAMLMENKSGVGSKKRLDRLACLIDSGYEGEVHFNLVNNGLSPQVIEPGEKIIQGVLFPIGGHEPVECEDPWAGERSARGKGGFGSTNN